MAVSFAAWTEHRRSHVIIGGSFHWMDSSLSYSFPVLVTLSIGRYCRIHSDAVCHVQVIAAVAQRVIN